MYCFYPINDVIRKNVKKMAIIPILCGSNKVINFDSSLNFTPHVWSNFICQREPPIQLLNQRLMLFSSPSIQVKPFIRYHDVKCFKPKRLYLFSFF